MLTDHKIEITHSRQNYNLAAIVEPSISSATMPLWNCTGWGEEEEFAIHLALIEYHEVGGFVMVLAFALLSGLAKLAFHHVHFLSSRIPESW